MACTVGGEEISTFFYETDDELDDVLYKVFLEKPSSGIIPLRIRIQADLEPASSGGYHLLNSCAAVYFPEDDMMVVKTGTATIGGDSPK